MSCDKTAFVYMHWRLFAAVSVENCMRLEKVRTYRKWRWSQIKALISSILGGDDDITMIAIVDYEKQNMRACVSGVQLSD